MAAAVQVRMPSVLAGYTGGAREVTAAGSTVAEVLADLDRQFPGIRFRMVNELDRLRPHVRLFVDGEAVAALDAAVPAGATLAILQRLSGG